MVDVTQQASEKVVNATQQATEKVTDATHIATQKVVEHSEKYKDAYDVIDQFAHAFWERLPYLCIALIVFFIFWCISKLFRLFLEKVLSNSSPQRQNLLLVLNRIGHVVILFIGFLIALVIVIPSFTPAQLVGSLGIGSVAIGFAFKDIFQNLLSGILILLSEPFKIGDYIQVEDLEGTVEDIQIRATHLRSVDGRKIIIPNATVYISPITVNTAYHERRCEFVVGISYDDDIEQAKQIICNVLNNNQHVIKERKFNVYVTTFADFSVNLTVRWWIDTTQILIVESVSEIQAEVKQAFDSANICIPYPIHTVKTENTPVAPITVTDKAP
ncbi:mechanosensitive ion channel family protein [Moraxella sp. ZY210820]|uniref:mechanosensitive ion channel family protein n=1 Tax=unclassified Moraxella TaxID=2685852 RepID=UPI00351F51C1